MNGFDMITLIDHPPTVDCLWYLQGGSPSWRGQGDVGKSHKASLLAANKREDREIAKLEKLLNLKKRKKKQKRLPASFHEEGLDCIHTT